MNGSQHILNKVRQFMDSHPFPPQGSKLIVGVSGGADSLALLHILNALGYECIVAHVNFQLRGDESEHDEIFVKKTALHMKLPFHSISFDTKTIAKKNSISIEMAARTLRYDWFETLRQNEKADAIAIGHHADDAIETFFINLIRGTGLRGLRGIDPVKNHIVRPLLCLTRHDTETYCLDHHLTYQIDSTNVDVSIMRNKIRHNIIPLLEEINPSFRQTMQKNIAALNDAFLMLFDAEKNVAPSWIETNEQIKFLNIDELMQQNNPHFLLFEQLKPYGFNKATIEKIIKSFNSSSGKQFFSLSHRLIKDRNQLILIPNKITSRTTFEIDHPDSTLSIEPHLIIQISAPFEARPIAFENDKTMIYVDADKLQFPLYIRHPKQGDFFYPLGMKNRKKLSDYFIDHKWNLFNKENAWLLCSNDQIIWIIGERLDDRFKLTEQTKSLIKIGIL